MATSRIEPELLNHLRENSTCNIIIEMRADTSSVISELEAQTFETRVDRLNTVNRTLKEFTAESQQGVLEFLQKIKEEKPTITFTGLWISNKIIVKNADLDLVERLAAIDEISMIRAEKVVELHKSLVKIKDAVKPTTENDKGESEPKSEPTAQK